MERRITVLLNLQLVKRATTRLASCAALAAMVSACGNEPVSRLNSDDALGYRGRDKVVTPPRAYYDTLLVDRMQLANSGALAAPQDPVLWLNFAGATVSKGFEMGQSFIPCKDNVTIPAAPISFNAQQQVANLVATHFSNAGAPVKVTTDQPAGGEYTTLHIGGSYADLGCKSGGSPVGVVPFDTGNANPSDIGFVFAQSGDLETLARTIAHEAGHTYGLDHSDNQDDLMYPWDMSSAVGFATGIASASGIAQDPATMLQIALGSGLASVSGIPVAPTMQVPSLNLPNVTIPSSLPNVPVQFANLPGLANFANLNSMVGAMPAAVNGLVGCMIPNITVGGMPLSFALQNSQGALGLLTVLLNASMGQNAGQFSMLQLIGLISGYPTMNIAQLISLAGISLSATQCITQLVPVNIPGITNAMPGQLQNGMNIAQILAMGSVSNPGQLIAMIPQYAQVIGVSAQGANAQALMSLVLMAVAQQYAAIPVQP